METYDIFEACETSETFNRYFSEIPDAIKPYLNKICEVECQLWCLMRSLLTLLNEKEWPEICMELLEELRDKELMYKELYGDEFITIFLLKYYVVFVYSHVVWR